MILISCASTEEKLSPIQKRQITTETFESDYDNVYKATLTVLQDQGYIIQNTDMQSGLIVGLVDRESSGGSQFMEALFLGYVADKGSKLQASCMVNEISEGTVELRINIQEAKYGQTSAFSSDVTQDVKRIYDEEIYNRLFNEIRLEIKRREAKERN